MLEATDATIDDAVRYVDPLVLRGVLYQLTGDEDLLDIELTTLLVGGVREMPQVARRGRRRPDPRQGGGFSQDRTGMPVPALCRSAPPSGTSRA